MVEYTLSRGTKSLGISLLGLIADLTRKVEYASSCSLLSSFVMNFLPLPVTDDLVYLPEKCVWELRPLPKCRLEEEEGSSDLTTTVE